MPDPFHVCSHDRTRNADALYCLQPRPKRDAEVRTHSRCKSANLQRVSFKGCLDTLRQFAHAMSGVEKKPKTIAAMIDDMLLTIARDLTPLRPGRSEPRVKKRRAKNYRLMTKPRKEMGPLPHRKVGVENHPKSPLT